MKVLVCVDHSAESQKVVQFVAGLLSSRAGADEITLFHVAEFLPEFLLSDHPEPGLTSRGLAERWAAKAKTRGEELLQERLQQLTTSGVPASAVTTKLAIKDSLPESKKVAAALAIIEEMQSQPYELVCVGRRGASALAASFIGGVAEKVLREAYGRNVLVVD